MPAIINWTGTVSNLWQDPRNWGGGVLPGPGDDVLIGFGAPLLLGGASARSVTVDMGANLTISRGATLSIPDGSLLNLGTTIVDNGTIFFGIVNPISFGEGFTNRGLLTGSSTNAIVGAFHNDGGVIQAGSPVGRLGFQRLFSNTGPTALGTVVVDLNGLIPGASYDLISTFPGPQDSPNNTDLGGQLIVHAPYSAAPGDSFRIVDNRSTGAVTGTFAGLPEGATLTADGQEFRISYVGGDGNDVTLTREPPAATFSWDGRPDAGGASADNLWTNPLNWAGDLAPTPGSALIFPSGAAQTTISNDFPAGTTFNMLSVVGPGYSISGNPINLSAGVIADIPTTSTSMLSLSISGTGGLTKWDAGTLVLTGSNSNSGETIVVGGTLDLANVSNMPAVAGNLIVAGGVVREQQSNQIGDSSAVRVLSGGTFNLNGQSDTVGDLTVSGGAIQIASGRLVAGNTSFAANSTLAMNILNAAAFDQIEVHGSVALNGFLQIALAAPLSIGAAVTLIDNDGADAISGAFANLPEGAVLSIGGSLLRISYRGGSDQNDVVLTSISPTSGQISGLVFTDTDGNGINSGEPGRDGVIVQLDIGANGTIDQTTTTAGGGLYTFNNLAAGSFQVRIATPSGFVQTTPNPFSFVLGTGQSLSGLDFGVFQTVSISGVKFNDRNGDGIRNNGEPGVGGVEIRIFPNGGGAIVQSTMTTADGSFVLSGIGPGVFQVRESAPPGTTQTTPDPAPITTTSGVNVAGLLFGNRADHVELFAVAEGAGGAPRVKVFNADGTMRFDFLAYDGRFTGGVRVATADINGDTIDDIVTAPGAGGGPHVQVFDGATAQRIQSFLAYSPAFTGGVYVGAGDTNNDGFADIVTGAGAGGGPHVVVFNGVGQALLQSFFPYIANFTGGVRVAAGDVNGDRFADIITGAGSGGGPHVQAFSGNDLGLLRSVIAFDPSFTGGVYVAAGDTNGDGRADVIVGAGEGGGPHIKVYSGSTGPILNDFFAYDRNFRGGVRVAAGDLNGDGMTDILTGPGPGGGPHVKAISPADLSAFENFMAFDPTFLGGIFVG